ncbi:DUF1440 domain-containing protein [Microaerobacter geothermalis]|uniref:DUF1440 domain-containing protein n=1 Tax=Microaerobacter geothermalis TaxID=674972 RepID=UPI001F347086|nr:DUF1440 domain-containing protein [Microaerobacter geothermalis]MCF6095200.1 DUF1440 domain-containing protein [Microaerobacter geothermalis]
MTETYADSKTPFYWKAGIVGSLIGGVVFGMLMAVMGMLPLIAGLIGSESSTVGFITHMAISFIFGITFTIFAGVTKWNGIVSGVVYGFILWFLFPFILMPIMMGSIEMAFQFNSGNLLSLIGHLMYGLTTGIVYKIMTR